MKSKDIEYKIGVNILEDLDNLKERMSKIEQTPSFRQTSGSVSAAFTSFPQIEQKNFYKPLIVVATITAVLMTIYEALKMWISPDLTLWQSHIVTIFFAAIIAPAGAYFAFKKIEDIRIQLVSELKERINTEKELLDIQERLESRVNERTAQLSSLNGELQKEVNMRRDTEESLRKYTEELLLNRDLLQNKAEELTVANDLLREKENSLTELNKSKDKFFSILAHDLRSPFTSLLGLTEFLENEIDSLDDEEVKKIVLNISVSSKKVYKLLENLLQWSRIQTGRIDFQPEKFSINHLINDVTELYKINAAKKEITINNLLHSEIEVFADKAMLETVLRNLVSNAIKFTSPGGIVNIIAHEQTSGIIQVTVADNGIGISRKLQNTVFDIDSNPSTPGTENEKGTGLGLVLCKEFVHKNKGKIWVESIPKKGSSFHFTIPVKA